MNQHGRGQPRSSSSHKGTGASVDKTSRDRRVVYAAIRFVRLSSEIRRANRVL